MSLAVVVIESTVAPARLEPWLEGDDRVTVAGPGAFADLPVLIDALDAEHVIVAARTPVGRIARLAATTLAAARPEVAVVHRVLPTTSLALAAAGLMALEERTVSIGVVGAFDQLVTQSRSGVWMRSITKLEHPKPSLGLHIRSMVSRGFVANTTPVADVTRALELRSDGSPLLVGAPENSAEFEAVATLAGPHPVRSVPALADVSRAHGSRGAEFIALDPIAAAQAPTGMCPVCGTYQSRSTCFFCHVHLRVPEPV